MKKVEYTPSNTVLVFDLHGVVLRPRIRERIWYILKNFYKLPLVFFCLPLVLWAWCTMRKQIRSGAGVLKTLCDRVPGMPYLEYDIIYLLNCQEWNTQVVHIIRALKALKFKVYLASNIGKRAYQLLCQKFHAHGKDLEGLFDQEVVVLEEDGWISKPDLRYYLHKVEPVLYEDHPETKHIIFVDDLKRNCKAAQKVGWEAVRFTSVHCLHECLIVRGIEI